MTNQGRAEVRILLCWALGEGLRVSRADILADLAGWRRRAGLTPAEPEPAATSPEPETPATEAEPGDAPEPATEAAPAEPEATPAAPTLVLVHPDRAITVAEAAARLGGIAEATVRRYLAPSSGRLARLGDGVSLASITAYQASRAAGIARSRWTAAEAGTDTAQAA